MGWLLLLALSLLLTAEAPLGEAANNSCSSQYLKDSHHLSSSGIHLTLHHPRSPCSPAPLPPLPFSDFLRHDEARIDALSSRLGLAAQPTTTTTHHHRLQRKPSLDRSSKASVPLSPGASYGVGNYITKISLGTPPKPYVVVVDTGSSLSWLQCSPCKVSCHDQVGPIFDPAASASYRPVPCSAPECDSLEAATLNPSGCSQSNVCVYEASYGDSSFSVGYLAKDTLTLSGSQSLPGFVYGCGQDNEGLFGESAGLVGLARNKLSLFSQLAARSGSAAFSYCLPSTSSSGYLAFGPGDAAASNFVYTPLVRNSRDATLYSLNLDGLTVGGKPLPVSASAYRSLPTIIDSGTVITRLPADVYSALSKAVVAAMAGHRRAPAYSILDTCFEGSAGGMAGVPEVEMVFAGGAAVRLPARNVLMDVDGGTTCLGFAAAGSVAIIGNRQQQTFKVLYDVSKSRVGFAAGGCG